VVLLPVIAIPAINLLVELNMKISFPEWMSGLEERITKAEAESEEMMDMFLSQVSTRRFLLNLLMISVIPAIGEELLFRGVLQKLLAEWLKNYHVAIFITAALFSFVHFQFQGFIPRVFLGILFGYLMVWTGSIWAPVLAHFVNNSLAVVFFFLYHRGLIHINLDTVGSSRDTLIYAALSAFLLFTLLGSIYIREVKKVN
jgi:membrane protease YdiL (CAAX protease family)